MRTGHIRYTSSYTGNTEFITSANTGKAAWYSEDHAIFISGEINARHPDIDACNFVPCDKTVGGCDCK